MLGREFPVPIDVVVEKPLNEIEEQCSIEYIEWMRQAMNRAYQFAFENFHLSFEKQKKYHDINTKRSSLILVLLISVAAQRLEWRTLGRPSMWTTRGPCRRNREVTSLLQQNGSLAVTYREQTRGPRMRDRKSDSTLATISWMTGISLKGASRVEVQTLCCGMPPMEAPPLPQEERELKMYLVFQCNDIDAACRSRELAKQ
jgi:hypothetical protein